MTAHDLSRQLLEALTEEANGAMDQRLQLRREFYRAIPITVENRWRYLHNFKVECYSALHQLAIEQLISLAAEKAAKLSKSAPPLPHAAE